MIVRIWRGWVSREDGDAYADYMQEVALPGYARMAGNQGLYMPRTGTVSRDEEFLRDREWMVRHYDVYGTVNVSAPGSA